MTRDQLVAGDDAWHRVCDRHTGLLLRLERVSVVRVTDTTRGLVVRVRAFETLRTVDVTPDSLAPLSAVQEVA